MPRLSIVIPCPHCDEQFENTLASVLQNRPQDCEVVVVFSGVYEDPYDLQDEVRFLEAPATASLLELINVGIEQSQGDVVHVLRCGAEVEDGWTDAPMRRFDKSLVGAVAPLVASRSRKSRHAVAGIHYSRGGSRRVCQVAPERAARRTPRILGPTLQAGFYRRESVCGLGGLDPDVGETLADVDVALSLRSAGLQAVCEPASRVFLESEAPANSRQFSAAARCEYLFWKHANQLGWVRSVAAHALVVAGEILQAVIRPSMLSCLCGRMYGCLSRPSRAKTAVAFSEKVKRPRRRQRSPSGGAEPSGETQYSDGRRRNVA